MPAGYESGADSSLAALAEPLAGLRSRAVRSDNRQLADETMAAGIGVCGKRTAIFSLPVVQRWGDLQPAPH